MTTSPTLLPQTVPASPRRWTSRWDDLAITRKLGIIGVLALAGLVIPVLLYSGKLNESVTISSNELRSYAPLSQMLGLINDLHAAHVDTGSAARDAAQRAERDLTQLLATTATLPGFERSQKELLALQQRHAAGAAADGYAAVSEQAFAALDALRDDSQLVYTPYIESYHLVVSTLIYSPDATESLTRLDAANDPSQAGDSRAMLREQLDQLARNHVRFRHELDKAMGLLEQPDPALADAANVEATQASVALAALATALDGSDAKADAQWNAALDALGQTMRELSKVSLQALQRQSERHLVDARNAMWQAIAGLSVLALLIAALGCYTLSRLTRNVRRAAAVAANLAQGQLDDHVVAAERDETGQLLATMRRMQEQLQRVLSAQSDMAQRHDAGQISFRMQADSFPGAYATMVRDTNALVGSHIAVKMKLAQIMSRYAIGDLSQDMDHLPGEKAVLTDTMDTVKANLSAMNSEIRLLAQAAANGDFSVRGECAALSIRFPRDGRQPQSIDGHCRCQSAFALDGVAGDCRRRSHHPHAWRFPWRVCAHARRRQCHRDPAGGYCRAHPALHRCHQRRCQRDCDRQSGPVTAHRATSRQSGRSRGLDGRTHLHRAQQRRACTSRKPIGGGCSHGRLARRCGSR